MVFTLVKHKTLHTSLSELKKKFIFTCSSFFYSQMIVHQLLQNTMQSLYKREHGY